MPLPPASVRGRSCRVESPPPAISTLMTWAPRSASCRVQNGPENTRAKSRTLTSSKASGTSFPFLLARAFLGWKPLPYMYDDCWRDWARTRGTLTTRTGLGFYHSLSPGDSTNSATASRRASYRCRTVSLAGTTILFSGGISPRGTRPSRHGCLPRSPLHILQPQSARCRLHLSEDPRTQNHHNCWPSR